MTVGKEVDRGWGAVAVTPSTTLAAVRSLVAGRSSRWAESMREPQPWGLGEGGGSLGVVGRKFSGAFAGWSVLVIYLTIDTLALQAARSVGCVGVSEAVVPDFLDLGFLQTVGGPIMPSLLGCSEGAGN